MTYPKSKQVTVLEHPKDWTIADWKRSGWLSGIRHIMQLRDEDYEPTDEELKEGLLILLRNGFVMRAPGTYGCVDWK